MLGDYVQIICIFNEIILVQFLSLHLLDINLMNVIKMHHVKALQAIHWHKNIFISINEDIKKVFIREIFKSN